MSSDYQTLRWPKYVAICLVSLLLCTLLMRAYWNRIQETYFDFALAQCSSGRSNAMANWHSWPEGLAFDAEVRRYRARNAEEEEVLNCVEGWSGWLMSSKGEVAGSTGPSNFSGIEVSISGSIYNPPERIFRVRRIKYVPPDDRFGKP